MKLDYDLIKEILQTVEDNSDGVTRKNITISSFKTHNESKQEYLRFNYHYKILFDIGLVVGESVEVYTTDSGMIPSHFYYTGLTFEGHETLDAMRNDTVWNKIKGNAKKAGIDGVRAIPSLAISMIKTGL